MSEHIPKGSNLTKRERDALLCICALGLTKKGAGQHLGVSSLTINSLLIRAYKRLDVHSAGAACYQMGARGHALVAVAKNGERAEEETP